MAEKKEEGLGETIKTVFWALIIAGLFRTLFFQPFWIPTASMKDTLLIGDFLFVNKMAYGYSRHSCPFSMCPFSGRLFASTPERGDVVVFRHPVNGTDYVKRLIGLPGDKVQVRDGVVFINGQEAVQVPDGTFEEVFEFQGRMGGEPKCANGPVGAGGICVKDKLVETLPGGVMHSILNITDRRSVDNTNVYTVPEKHYFFIGDNRDNSTDSRVDPRAGGVGYVHEDFLLGRADRVIFSARGKRLLYFWTWRSDRFFKAIE
jgi:signal peptidase I